MNEFYWAVFGVVLGFFLDRLFIKWDLSLKCGRIEEYLKSEKENAGDKGQRTLLHLKKHTGMTEAQLLEASFRSKNIERKLSKDPDTGLADVLFLEWKE